jgi:hypothetical protein
VGLSMPIESWPASPRAVPAPQYIARSATIGLLPWTWVDRSVLETSATSFTLIVLLESGGIVKVGCVTGPDGVIYVKVTSTGLLFGFWTSR